MIYRETRNYDNQQLRIFDGVGKYGMPIIKSQDFDVSDLAKSRWVSFNYMLTEKHPEECVLHFYVDDYQFDRVWKNPNRYIDKMRKFKAVVSPDFSMYTDFPYAINMHNCFKNHWLGAYWQENGVNVVPCVGWSNQDSFDFCLDGYERGTKVMAIATTGTQANKESKKLFEEGLFKMLDVLNPKNLLVYSDRNKIDCLENCSLKVDTNIILIKNPNVQRLKEIAK